jgi:hypothetical protein
MDFHLVLTFLIIIIGVYFSSLKNANSLKIRRAYLIIITISLILESALRGLSVGTDTLTYSDSFQEMKNTSWDEITQNFTYINNSGYNERNQGYNLFQKIFQIFSDDFRIYLFFIATCFFSSLYYFLYKSTFNLFELILAYAIYAALFYYFFSITGIKQTITSTVALYCTRFIIQRKLIWFIIFVLLASLIHFSILVFLPAYFLPILKKIKLNFLLSFFLFGIIFIFKKEVVAVLITDSIYQGYLSDLEGKGTLGFTSFLFLVVLISYFVVEKMAKTYSNYITYYNFVLIALVLVPLTWVNSNAMRVVQYYSIFILIFAPKIIEALFKNDIIFKRTVYFSCIAFLFFFIFQSSSTYKFFWEEVGIYRDL